MTLGRFTDAAVTLYDKLQDLVNAQQAWSEKQFGPARERDARGPLDHLKKECGELYDLIEQWNAGNLPPERAGEIDKEIADLLILFLDVLWRTGRKFGAAVDAAAAKMEENVKREWPAYRGWSVLTPEQFQGQWRTEFRRHATIDEAGFIRGGQFGVGTTPEAATEDAYRQIRDLNAHCVEHVRDMPPQSSGLDLGQRDEHLMTITFACLICNHLVFYKPDTTDVTCQHCNARYRITGAEASVEHVRDAEQKENP